MALTSRSITDDDDALITDINVTPLVDVVLVLLIVFMITMPSIVASELLREKAIRLPQSRSAVPLTSSVPAIAVTIDERGNFLVDGKPTAEKELRELLEQAVVDNPGRVRVLIRADRDCAWQHVVVMMSLCDDAGVADYSVTAQ